MAAPRACNAQVIAGGPGVVFPSQLFGQWKTVISDAETGAESASSLLNPASYSGITRPLIVGEGSVIRLILQYSLFVLTPASPAIRVYGCDQIPNASGTYPTGSIFWRLDASGFTAASSSFTVDLTNDQYDNAESKFTVPMTNAGMPLRGAKSVLVLLASSGVGDGLGMPIHAEIF
jgi:hypothetical protein